MPLLLQLGLVTLKLRKKLIKMGKEEGWRIKNFFCWGHQKQQELKSNKDAMGTDFNK